MKPLTYSHIDVLMASPTEPISKDKRVHQLTCMFEGLSGLERDEKPSPDHWAWVSDAVMLMDVLRGMGVVEDPDGMIQDGFNALGRAADRALSGGNLRLDGPAIMAVRAVLEDYASLLEQIPARTMISAHRKAEKKTFEIMGRRK